MTTPLQTYRVRFTRYAHGERRTTPHVFLQAVDFATAVQRAQDRLAGMAMADPMADFDVAAVEQEGLGGLACEVGFRTMDEHLSEVGEEVASELDGRTRLEQAAGRRS